ncbi:MAG: PDZ domain-containing protein, partial [Planctomycetota bacterium]
GIGFAVPLALAKPRLARLQRGEDIRRGLAGLAFIDGADHATKPVLLTLHPGGPADRAGLKAEDMLLTVNGQAVETVAAYRFAAHALDDGEQMTVTVRRGDEELSAELTLAPELSAYRHPYLGLAMAPPTVGEGEPRPGVLIRAAFEGSPAAKAGVVAGDRLIEIGGEAITSRDEAMNALAKATIGETLVIKIARGRDTLTLSPILAPLDYSAALDADVLSALGEVSEVEVEELAVAGTKRVARVTAPKEPEPTRPLIITLTDRDGPSSAEPLAKSGVLVAELAVEQQDSSLEAEKVAVLAVLESLASRPGVDPRRVALAGYGRTSPLALALAIELRDRFAGVVIDRWPGRPARVPANRPGDRLGVLVRDRAPRGKAAAEQIESRGYPTRLDDADKPSPRELASWLRGLDRF